MNQKGIVLSGLIYALLVFFLLLLASFLTVLWYRQSAINNLGKDAHDIYDEVPIPFTTDFSYSEGVNVPKLAAGMTAIKWDGSAWVTTNESDSAWFDYKNKQWANARTTDGSMWVWIPRYAYQITSGYHTSTVGVISVKFLIDLTDIAADGTTTAVSPTYIADSQTNYITHPAFKFGDTELTGMWVAKFEPSVSDTSSLCYTSASAANCNVTTLSPKIIPNAYSWRYIEVGNSFTVARNMELNSIYGWGTTGVGLDTHIAKNTEWGAITYLAQSAYGKNDIIWMNPNSDYKTGCAGTMTTLNATTACNQYDTTNGVKASTTGNIYGIYDIVGGSWEQTAAYLNNGNSNLTDYGSSVINANAKYKDVYEKGATDNDVSNYALTINKIGDALYETSSSYSGSTAWYSSSTVMPNTSYAWLYRGGSNSTYTATGPFYFSGYFGYSHGGFSFRPILLISPGL